MMRHRPHVEAVDRTLEDHRSLDMRGMTFVFAGGFFLALAVVRRRTNADILKVCLKSSPLWRSVQEITLRTNMRARLGDNVSTITSR